MIEQTKNFEILVAEDNPADITLVREALKQHCIECSLHVIRDGMKVVAFIDSSDKDPKAHPPDLLLLDIHLPKRDGEEILRHFWSTELYAQTPVVVMTSSNFNTATHEVYKHAALLSYFRKPSTLDEFMELGAIVRRILIGGESRQPADESRLMKNIEDVA
jgi:CheY-like chemotaxis protein